MTKVQREVIELVASVPLEDFAMEDWPDHQIYGMNDWKFTVADVLKARSILMKSKQ